MSFIGTGDASFSKGALTHPQSLAESVSVADARTSSYIPLLVSPCVQWIFEPVRRVHPEGPGPDQGGNIFKTDVSVTLIVNRRMGSRRTIGWPTHVLIGRVLLKLRDVFQCFEPPV